MISGTRGIHDCLPSQLFWGGAASFNNWDIVGKAGNLVTSFIMWT